MYLWFHMMTTAFWDIAPCSLAEVNRRFTDAYCLRYHGGHGYIRRSIPQGCLHNHRRGQPEVSQGFVCFPEQTVVIIAEK
jgi:hypothetical protein